MNYETANTPEQLKNERTNSTLTGAIFIIMGGIFFLGVSGITILGRSPWMLVALLPALWIGAAAYRRYQKEGRFSRRVYGTLVFGLLPFAYIIAIFLGINVGAIWPIGLIAVGVSFIAFGRN